MFAAAGTDNELALGKDLGEFALDDGGGFFGAASDENRVSAGHLVEGGGCNGERFSSPRGTVANGQGMLGCRAEELLLGRAELAGREIVGGGLVDFIKSGNGLSQDCLQGGRKLGGGLGEEFF